MTTVRRWTLRNGAAVGTHIAGKGGGENLGEDLTICRRIVFLKKLLLLNLYGIPRYSVSEELNLNTNLCIMSVNLLLAFPSYLPA